MTLAEPARIVILTGAGISTESGLSTFRDADRLWTRYDLRQVATPQGFAHNPTLVHDFYNARRSTSNPRKFVEAIYGPASEVVPAYVARLLEKS